VPTLDPNTPSPIFGGSTGGLLRKAQVEEFYVLTWEAPKEMIFEMPVRTRRVVLPIATRAGGLARGGLRAPPQGSPSPKLDGQNVNHHMTQSGVSRGLLGRMGWNGAAAGRDYSSSAALRRSSLHHARWEKPPFRVLERSVQYQRGDELEKPHTYDQQNILPFLQNPNKSSRPAARRSCARAPTC
jgi:hypothetical protein